MRIFTEPQIIAERLTRARPAMLPPRLLHTLRHLRQTPTRFLLVVSIQSQSMQLWEAHWHRTQNGPARPLYYPGKPMRVSTSRFGIGQQAGSNRTPLGLHRIAAKIGAGQPIGAVFRSRQAVGFTWQGMPNAPIVHRILWLEGLEPGRNRGGEVDSYQRYIYIHGTGDELSLGRPASKGCIHLAAADLLPLFDKLPVGTMVWIDSNSAHHAECRSAA